MSDQFTAFHLFCGLGGGALGFQRAGFRTLGGVDSDADACADFAALTGVPATCLDLFSAADYRDFHGDEPPTDWSEATPADIRAAAGGERPDVVFTSPPCKGFSGLLPKASSASAKYQALNRLTLRGVWLVLEAWKDTRPGLIILENVPRITSRGANLLAAIKDMLATYGYAIHDDTHDVGAVGNLAQHRRRYLLVARHKTTVPAFLYQPPKKPVRAIGSVLETMPMPDDPAAGPMHRLPRLAWKTWVRLALIPAGGDWRDLQGIQDGDYLVQPHMDADRTHPGKYAVEDWRAPARTVTGSRMGSGGQAVADPRLGHSPRKRVYKVGRWEEPANTIIGTASVRGSNGMAAVAGPRVPRKDGRHASHLRVTRWDDAGPTVTGATHVANGLPSVADPRLGCKPRSGAYRVISMDEPATTVTGAGDVHSQGAACVADPRIPDDSENGAWVIVALDGTWHRPLTTLELAALQGFPLTLPDGSPLVLAGKSQSRWRERVGNAVPPPAAEAIGRAMNEVLTAARLGRWLAPVIGAVLWVRRQAEGWRVG